MPTPPQHPLHATGSLLALAREQHYPAVAKAGGLEPPVDVLVLVHHMALVLFLDISDSDVMPFPRIS
jgi:hypothetical protein